MLINNMTCIHPHASNVGIVVTDRRYYDAKNIEIPQIFEMEQQVHRYCERDNGTARGNIWRGCPSPREATARDAYIRSSPDVGIKFRC